jgi:hypothetical protein
VVELDVGTRSIVSELQVWNSDYAFTYPALATNLEPEEVAIILGWGGSANHANCAMGILGDFVVWFRDDSTRTVRFGHYLTTRRCDRNSRLFAGFGYFVSELTGQPDRCTYTPFYARYDRS